MWLWRVVCLKKLSSNKEIICPGRNSNFVPRQLANKLEEGRVGDKMSLLFCGVFILWIYWYTDFIKLMEGCSKK